MKFLRSVLFVPGDDPQKSVKAYSTGADAVIFDWEDAVAFERKNAAREITKEILQKFPAPVTTFVRVNDVFSPYIYKDLLAVVELPVDAIMLAKTEAAEDIRRVDWLLGLLEKESNQEPGRLFIVPFIESARGIEKAEEIASACPRVWCLAFGGNDYTMEIGAGYSQQGTEKFYARCRLINASRSAGIEPPLDTVNPNFKDIMDFQEEVKRVKQLGFQGKLVIHPAQVAPANEALSPSKDEIAWAKKVIEVFAQAREKGLGVIQMDGKMIELPVFRRAQQILSLLDQ